MKLEELRQRLREPGHDRDQPTPGARSKRRKKKRRRAQGPDFGISFTLKTKDGPVTGYMYRCKKCKKRFVPDPKLGYVPSVCASCDSYL